jgi:transcriptional regulator with XRE-family HTH domain
MKMMNKNKQTYRDVLGERLRTFREDRGLTVYKVAKNGGIRIDQVKAIESGGTNYTIDSLLGYILGNDLYIYFAEKSEGRENPHDFKDIAGKAIDNDPKI